MGVKEEEAGVGEDWSPVLGDQTGSLTLRRLLVAIIPHRPPKASDRALYYRSRTKYELCPVLT